MDQKPLVSVVIPVYNRMNTISAAIESVLKQTYKKLEIIVVDDGSIDETQEALKKYISAIKYYYKNNGGVSSARNVGIKEAHGEYIALLDSDDLWASSKIEKQMEYLIEHADFGMAITDVEYLQDNCNETKTSKLRNIINNDGYILEYLLKLPFMTCSYMTVKKEVFENVGYFDESFKTANDFDMMLRICHKYKTVLIEEPLVKYKKSTNSVSNRIFSGNRLRAIEKLYAYAPDLAKSNKSIIQKTKARIHLEYADDLLWNRYIKEAQKQIFKSIVCKVTYNAVKLYVKCLVFQILSLFYTKYRDKGKFGQI